MENCYCCGQQVSDPERKKRRRSLSTPGSSLFLQTLKPLISSVADPLAAVDLAKLHTGYLCRGCSSLMEAFFNKINNKLVRAIPILPKVVESSSDEPANVSQLGARTCSVIAASDVSSPPVTVSSSSLCT